jgi:hypothetical protein
MFIVFVSCYNEREREREREREVVHMRDLVIEVGLVGF